ncbi:MAG: hypothetical protein QMC90_03825 [Dehalococcoidales bacterium]|nr:hypothetical protein [Dehalococcoidales bacterium]
MVTGRDIRGPMRCPRCGAVTWGWLKYCLECGQSLNISCPSCGGGWRYFYYYPYCPQCGAKTDQEYIEAVHGKRR